ncbi:hypothetical protein ELH42_13195 [Rhizobium ruizarguesonis]|uniref:hypothetical protein n=1 Tax=Rhizobium ruizarguesonis TaxID=2081791 RepID=UPI0010311A55|nr:hypothetical protein [Rhizobium ruizarguesonis]TBB67054.1 hypothetical protein ELH42_13195 [Rhizobium ruizarguesonis]
MTGDFIQKTYGKTTAELVGQLRKLADDIESAGERDFLPETSAVLDEWFMGQRAVPCLLGRFDGHPKLEDGKPGFTSQVFYVDDSRKIARTLTRWYLLGDRVNVEQRKSITGKRP